MRRRFPARPSLFIGLVGVLLAGGRAPADETVRLKELFPADYQYHVSTRVTLTGQLTLPPPDKDKKPVTLPVKGSSTIEYDERVLDAKDDAVSRTVRVYRQMDFDRKVGDQAQTSTLRPEARRLVLLREKQFKGPFCPEGPLTPGEIDLVRTDVFTPALAGLLPDGAVKPGDRWMAQNSAVRELTDLDGIDGRVECKLIDVRTLRGRRCAYVTLSGTVKGTNEDGRAEHRLDGSFYFDLESNQLTYLSLRGVQSLLDRDGKEVGRVEGQFTLTRETNPAVKELSAAAMKGLTLTPTADNTLLLYDNAELGLRFVYPRRWRVAGGVGRQVRLDGADGSGLQITLDPPAKAPTGAQFLAESRDYFASQKAKVYRADPPQRVRGGTGELEHFTIDVEVKNDRVLMDYYVARQDNGGATLAARLLPGAELAAVQKEVERIAKSVTVTKAIK
ncbi:MAG TPA: hypothetical protein VFW33_04595 [Gemmataceae bacterium]|nr:hypothetical protein [Gemmataceae bacterium]